MIRIGTSNNSNRNGSKKSIIRKIFKIEDED
jgi:hypothetical protein